jgi:hypothetical protein
MPEDLEAELAELIGTTVERLRRMTEDEVIKALVGDDLS